MKSIEQQMIFTHLKGKVFAEYNIIYHINDGYSIKELNQFSTKHQLLFQKFSSKVQQMNLMFVDSIFPIHLADVALETFLNEVSSFKEYTFLQKDFVVIDIKRDINYFTRKFYDFILHLLFSNIASDTVFREEIQRDNVYCLKDESGELRYYSIYEQRELQDLLFDKMRLEINLKDSFIRKQNLTLSFRIAVS
jgi:hypothetical protein